MNNSLSRTTINRWIGFNVLKLHPTTPIDLQTIIDEKNSSLGYLFKISLLTAVNNLKQHKIWKRY
tara:strand:+ start:60 stop:254 length:195 start_codon:yes stop_codon:yes gene_type:complete